MDEPLYVAKPASVSFEKVWGVFMLLWWGMIGALGFFSEAGIVLVFFLLLGVVSFGLYYAMLPRRFEVRAESLAIVFNAGTWLIPMSSITGIHRFPTWQTIFFMGGRAGGWPARTSLIETRAPKPWYISFLARSPDVIISAHDHDAFIGALEDARAKYAAQSSSTRSS